MIGQSCNDLHHKVSSSLMNLQYHIHYRNIKAEAALKAIKVELMLTATTLNLLFYQITSCEIRFCFFIFMISAQVRFRQNTFTCFWCKASCLKATLEPGDTVIGADHLLSWYQNSQNRQCCTGYKWILLLV